MDRPRLGEHGEGRWQEVVTGMRDWRTAHPRATFAEIETALDERLQRLRAHMLADTALASATADLPALAPSARPRCPQCDVVLVARGQESRTLLIHGGEPVPLRRHYAACPACGAGLFPPR